VGRGATHAIDVNDTAVTSLIGPSDDRTGIGARLMLESGRRLPGDVVDASPTPRWLAVDAIHPGKGALESEANESKRCSRTSVAHERLCSIAHGQIETPGGCHQRGDREVLDRATARFTCSMDQYDFRTPPRAVPTHCCACRTDDASRLINAELRRARRCIEYVADC
jgi:hypothetical protein